MKLADSHIHLYAGEFDGDREAVFSRALEAGVERLFLPAIDREHHENMIRLALQEPEHCFPMMGLHPTSVGEDFREELNAVEDYLSENHLRYYGIGEVGIDLYWDKTWISEQVVALESQFDMAIRFDLPLVIHTRNSMDIVLELLEKRSDARLRGIFHCFGGNIRQAERAVDLGFHLGIGGVLTYKNSGLQQVVAAIGLKHLVLETDAPWLPPVPHRGRRNEPCFLPLVAQRLAEILKVPYDEISHITYNHTMKIFGLQG